MRNNVVAVWGSGLVCLGFLLGMPVRPAMGGLVTSISQNGLFASAFDSDYKGDDFIQFDITGLVDSISQSVSRGGSAANIRYSLTNDATSAVLRVDIDISLADHTTGGVLESEQSPPPPFLTFSAPVQYQMQARVRATGTNLTASVGGSASTSIDNLRTPNQHNLTSDNPDLVLPTVSGELPASGGYFREMLGLSHAGTAGQGTGYFQLTLTAVPLPPAFWIAITALPLVLFGRRICFRRTKSASEFSIRV